MPIKIVSGEVDSQDLNDNFSHLDSKLDQVNGGPLGSLSSEAELNQKYPNGANGFFIINGNMWFWEGGKWVDKGVYQAMSVPQDSVDRKELKTAVNSELDTYAENNIYKNFELANANFFHPGINLVRYNQFLGAVKDLVLIGFNPEKDYKLRILARNHESFNYRFIISYRDAESGPWIDIFDTGSSFKVTENPLGVTTVSHTINDKTVLIKINYNEIPNGLSVNDGGLSAGEGRYKIKKNCFFQNSIQSAKENILKLENMISDGVVVNRQGTSIQIKYRKHEELNEVVEFNELGINKIIHPKKFYEEKATYLTSDFSNLKTKYTLTTDWISPYQNVQAKNGGINSFSGTVGGNHGTNGAGGFPTAETIDLEVLVDNRKINNNQMAAGGVVTIVVKNVISAPNKINLVTGEKAESLLETVIYKVTENNIEVFANIEALEDLSIGGYVGLQMTADILSGGEIYFLDGFNKYKSDGKLHNSLPLPFKNDRIVLEKGNQVVVTQTKRSYGIGDLRFKGTAPIHFISEFHKLYSHLINTVVELKKGESLEYSGSYTFSEKIKCNGAEAAYTIVENGVKVFCVDFLKETSDTYLKMPSYLVGSKIEIIESINVDSDSIISVSGLRLKSSAVGFIKFKVGD